MRPGAELASSMLMEEIGSIMLLSVGVALDATAVASTAALAYRDFRLVDAARMGITFGLFQGGMALAGWLGGTSFIQYIAAWDHWVAFILLAFIGGGMIIASFRRDEQIEPALLSTTILLSLALATSIDALAVGVTLGVLKTSPVFSCSAIAAVTTLLSFLAAASSSRLGARFGKRLETVGGVLLILIGGQILFQHLR